jgi:sporulation protein YlmC with PRC-barrel domain
MWKQLSTTGALAAILLAGPALAQQPSSETTEPPAATEQSPADQNAEPAKDAASTADKSAQAGDLAGQSVYSADGKELGEVTEVNTSSDGSIESIHVNTGAFLGMGGRTVEVSADQFTQNEDRIELTLNAEEVEALPEVKVE